MKAFLIFAFTILLHEGCQRGWLTGASIQGKDVCFAPWVCLAASARGLHQSISQRPATADRARLAHAKVEGKMFEASARPLPRSAARHLWCAAVRLRGSCSTAAPPSRTNPGGLAQHSPPQAHAKSSRRRLQHCPWARGRMPSTLTPSGAPPWTTARSGCPERTMPFSGPELASVLLASCSRI